jgi:hypothetical protein
LCIIFYITVIDFLFLLYYNETNKRYIGGNTMMDLEFYRNIPKKECSECGCEIQEQHESYLYECERCMGIHEE